MFIEINHKFPYINLSQFINAKLGNTKMIKINRFFHHFSDDLNQLHFPTSK